MSGAARKLASVADTLSDIADTVNAVCQRQMPPKGESFDFVVEQVARTTCQSCTRRNRCWVRGYATAMDGLYHLKPILEGQGRVEVQDLPGQLSVCIHPADLCTAANHGYRLWRSRRQTRAPAPWPGRWPSWRANWVRPGCRTPGGRQKWPSCLRTWGWTRWNAA